jgi:hypothetical protein
VIIERGDWRGDYKVEIGGRRWSKFPRFAGPAIGAFGRPQDVSFTGDSDITLMAKTCVLRRDFSKLGER